MDQQMIYVKYPIEKLKLEECEDSKGLLKRFEESYEIEVVTRLLSEMKKDYRYNEE